MGRFQSSPGTPASGGSSCGQDGATNTGNGAGAANTLFGFKNGGSGVVVIRYTTPV